MSNEIPLGLAVDVGGTNYRTSINDNGKLLALDSANSTFDMISVPRTAQEFYEQLASSITTAQEKGAEWVVAGLPCPVKTTEHEDWAGDAVDPASAFHGEPRSVQAELRSRGIDPSFPVNAINDVEQFAFAAASRRASPTDTSVLGISIGTGLGTGFVERESSGDIWQSRGYLLELGTFFRHRQTKRTFQDLISGTAISSDERTLSPADHETDWHRRGIYLGDFIATNSMILGPDLVVIGGGSGAAHRSKFEPGMEDFLATQNSVLFKRPRIEFIDRDEADHFALYGAAAVAKAKFYRAPQPIYAPRDRHRTRPATT